MATDPLVSPMSDADTDVVLTYDQLDELLQACLRRSGMSELNARVIADTLASSERDGAQSHGLQRLSGFIKAVSDGWADGQSVPSIIREGPALLVIDALNGFAQAATAIARERLTEMTRSSGVAVLLVRNAHHFAALWPDLEGFARGGLVGLACVNSRPRMAIWGASRSVIGTNAMAFASPRAGHDPLVWDQSSSVMSQGDLLMAADRRSEVQPGVGFDKEGRPSTSPADILDGGALAPFGQGKGASIAVMVEVLAAALTGGDFGFAEPKPPSQLSPSKGGYFLLLVDPAHSGSDVAARVDVLSEAILGSGAGRLPGDRRYEFRRRSLAQGIRIPVAFYESLLEPGRSLGKQ